MNVSIANRSSKTVKKIKVQGKAHITTARMCVCVYIVCVHVCLCVCVSVCVFNYCATYLYPVRQFASICLFAQSEYKCVVAQLESE